MSETITINTSDIDLSKQNVRKKHPKKAIEEMAASIRSIGVINLPTVVKQKKGSRYDVIAGMLRVLGALEAEKTHIEVVLLKQGMAEAELVELSLAENVTRQEMDELERFVAFDKLFKAGTSIEAIARSFKMEERAVRQSLAIGSLPKAIITMATQQTLWAGALEALTVATKQQLESFIKLPARNRPKTGWQIKTWLQKKKQLISASFALFDVDQYKGGIIDDLFADDNDYRCFADPDEFWKLQQAAINEKVAKLKAAGWPIVNVTEWRAYDWKKAGKSKGGKVIVAVMKSGEVVIKKGLISVDSKAKSTSGTKRQAQPELSGAMQEYCRAHRHLAIQDALTQDSQVALALCVTLLLTGGRGWRTDVEKFARIQNRQHAISVAGSWHRAACHDESAWLHKQLGVKAGLSHWQMDSAKVLSTAVEFDEESLLAMLSVLVSERLACAYQGENGDLDNLLASLLDLEDVAEWKPDASFWSSIRSREAMLGILREMASPKLLKAIPSGATLKDLRAAAVKYASLDRLRDWRPAWLRFPAGAYTKKHGLSFVGRKS